MHIEVIAPKSSSNTERGKLLEDMAAELLRIQNYSVSQQVRLTASELDLLCTHQVSQLVVYVECKAHRDPLPASVLVQLIGNVSLKGYSEGWLLSTGPLSKDAKGLLVEWGRKPDDERRRLSIYDPDRLLQTLQNAGLVTSPPTRVASVYVGSPRGLGDWVLLVSPWGRYWATTVLQDGVPTAFVAFSAGQECLPAGEELLSKIGECDTSFAHIPPFANPSTSTTGLQEPHSSTVGVVEVESADKWTDYRPCRPEHFVGRAKALREIMGLLSAVKKRSTDTRIFAVTGDSGIGKSSMIAKLRDVAKSSRKPNNLCLLAVDVRAAGRSTYVLSSLVAALRRAQTSGFGCQGELAVTDYADPLQSESIRSFLAECERKHELVILVFDQFEELFSKAELFPVFEEARKLMFSAVSAGTSLVVGFAWKTDSTVPQGHPAYHMWHQLADHRREVLLPPFSHSDAEASFGLFETELGQKVRHELRRYLIQNSQGFPWLLKKLCIHLYDQMEAGITQHELSDRSLDIGGLFDRDLSSLSPAEMGCLKLVARSAPMDWFEVLQTAGPEVVQSLQNRRLLIRRGDKLNLYWDIFRDYVLNGTIPDIPLTYIPQSPSVEALVRVALQLDPAEGRDAGRLARLASLAETTVGNIVHDLEQFGIASLADDGVRLEGHMRTLTGESVLARVRFVLKRHALTEMLRDNHAGRPATPEALLGYLKQLNPTAQHHTRTWKAYAAKLSLWLTVLGYAERAATGVIYRDAGRVTGCTGKRYGGDRRGVVFIGDASPAMVVDVLEAVIDGRSLPFADAMSLGYRNACGVLQRFRLVGLSPTHRYQFSGEVGTPKRSAELVWEAAAQEDSVIYAASLLRERPALTGPELGRLIAAEFARKWEPASCVRVGNGLRKWAAWILTTKSPDGAPGVPPGRPKRLPNHPRQGLLFE